ncbi:unnamed protein product [Orchesella dallaii]|uniref:Major facilitator superfamily (MFS) profile domain-containing protein n=1 Tax=Orchesella dallaii TaxID=48710 RepID=A0ABP1QA90_9HEXA
MEMEDIGPVKRPKGWGSRHTMAILGCWAFAMSYAMRFNISIAIVSMVNQTAVTIDKNENGSNFNISDASGTCDHLRVVIEEEFDENGTLIEKEEIVDEIVGEFDWSPTEQGVILGSFFWGYVLTQMPGGILSHRYGGKWPLGIGLFLAGIATVLTPLAARTHKYVLCLARVVCGLGEGFAFPAMHGLLASWAPPDEKSKLASIVYAGAQFGTAATMIMSGYLIHGNILGGWPSVFYVIGTLTIVWFVLWCFFVYDTPAQHPRISIEELNFIEKSIGNQTSKVKVPTPWRAILTSMPFWAILVGHIGHAWGLYTLLHELPTYLKNMLHFDIRQNSWLSALPYLVMWILSIFITQIADLLISRKILRTVVVRKGCQSIGKRHKMQGYLNWHAYILLSDRIHIIVLSRYYYNSNKYDSSWDN